MNTAMIPQPRAEINSSRFNGDYKKLSRRCDQVLTRGLLIVCRYCEIGGEQFGAVLTRRIDKQDECWAAVNFIPCAPPDKSRRVLILPDGQAWLLLGNSMTAISSNNKYAKYADRLLREKAGN